MKAQIGGAAALVALFATACGASDEWSSSLTTYRSAETKLNKAHDAFNATLDKANQQSTADYLPTIAAFTSALETFNNTLTTKKWPMAAQADATALVAADTNMIKALNAISDAVKSNSAVNLESLGTDLGTATDDAANAATQFEADLVSRGRGTMPTPTPNSGSSQGPGVPTTSAG